MIVTSNRVFVVDATDEELSIQETKWAKIKRTFESKDLSGDLRADVVSFAHWDEYVATRIIKVIDNAADVLTKNAHLFDPEWLLYNLGEPEYTEDFSKWLQYYRDQREKNNSQEV